jgi:hypothetical protein
MMVCWLERKKRRAKGGRRLGVWLCDVRVDVKERGGMDIMDG